MTTHPAHASELLALVADVREYVSYWQELGAEYADAPAALAEALPLSAAVSQTAPPRPVSSVYTPHPMPVAPASATENKPLENKPARIVLPPPPPTSTVRPPAQPVMNQTLFGDIAPDNSLPVVNETLEDIRRDIGPDCTRCPLGTQGRKCVVNSEGNRQARLMFVGEAPGANEDAQGRPFVGQAGQLLTKIIEAIGIRRPDVFIGNINRCRPPQNRTPTIEEAQVCRPFLKREIAVVRPEVIVVMGNTAIRNLLDLKEGVTRLRGTFRDYYGVKVMPTFHPAYLLRDPSKKRETWEDMKKVRDLLRETAPKP